MSAVAQVQQALTPAVTQSLASAHPERRRPFVSIFLNDLSGGGAERQTLMLARGLCAAGLTVELVLHQLRGELRDELPPGIKVVNLNRKRTRHDILPLSRYLRQRRPDILLSNIDHKNIAAVLSRVLSGTGTKMVITQHNSLFGAFTKDGRRYRIIAPGYRLLAPFLDAAVVVSDGLGRELTQLAGIPASKVVRIYNGAIGEDFELRADAPVVHPWFTDRRTPVFVTAGRLVAQKDHETLLRALALYRQSGNGRLIILGSGPMREQLSALAGELGIADAVDFVGFSDNPLPWFRKSDLFVLSSLTEGFGLALVEAMGCGTPVVSTDSGHGPAEILAQGRYGVLIPTRDPVAMAAALSAVKEIRARFDPEILKARANEFTNANSISGYLALFDRLMPEAAPAPAGS